jgi:hypothetical protein
MPNNFYRIYLGLGTQLLGQWSGAQSITIVSSVNPFIALCFYEPFADIC